MEANAMANQLGTLKARVFEQEGERFTLREFVDANREDLEVGDMVADLDTLAVGEELRFGIGGGWGEPIRRVE